jgi:hypothetical protein
LIKTLNQASALAWKKGQASQDHPDLNHNLFEEHTYKEKNATRTSGFA